MRTHREEKVERLSGSSGGSKDGGSTLTDALATRRKFLGELLIATAGTVSLAGFARPQRASGATVRKTMTRNGNTLTFGPIRAPDGFPQASICGTLVGTRGAYCMVSAGESVVPVTVLPTTEVLGGGARWKGALNPLSVGDRVFIFTRIVDSGERVATKIEQNPRLYDLSVSSISGSQITGTTLPSDATPGLPLELTVNALTKFQQARVPQVGGKIRVATISDAHARHVVAMNVVALN